MSKKVFDVRKLVFSAVCIALSTVSANLLSFHLPFGGSITFFSMFFICFAGYMYGPAVGISAAVAHGLLQFISNPYIVHPIQVILDYFLAFGALGISGFFHNRKRGLYTGYIAGVLGRLFFACISGAIFFTEYTGSVMDNFAAVMSGVIYNLTYIGPEMVVTLGLLLIPHVRNAVNYVKKIANSQAN